MPTTTALLRRALRLIHPDVLSAASDPGAAQAANDEALRVSVGSARSTGAVVAARPPCRLIYPLSLSLSLSSQTLNAYLAALASGSPITPSAVEFFILGDGGGENEGAQTPTLTRVRAALPATGSLGPLFAALGLIPSAASGDAEWGGRGRGGEGGGDSEDLISFLAAASATAAAAGAAHAGAARALREATAAAAARWGLAALEVGACTAASPASAMRAATAAVAWFDGGLAGGGGGGEGGRDDAGPGALLLPALLAGLSIHLEAEGGGEPGSPGPAFATTAAPPCSPRPRLPLVHVRPDGGLGVRVPGGGGGAAAASASAAEAAAALPAALARADLRAARALSAAAAHWRSRADALAPAVCDVLGSEAVWRAPGTQHAAFCAWAGGVLAHTADPAGGEGGDGGGGSALEQPATPPSPLLPPLLVHDDSSAPWIELAGGAVQVRVDAPGHVVLGWAAAHGPAAAGAAAAAAAAAASEEAALLAAASALGARAVVRIAPTAAPADGEAAAHRLIAAAPALAAAGVALGGVVVALDDGGWAVWGVGGGGGLGSAGDADADADATDDVGVGAGIVSIPIDFPDPEELASGLAGLLGSGGGGRRAARRGGPPPPGALPKRRQARPLAALRLGRPAVAAVFPPRAPPPPGLRLVRL